MTDTMQVFRFICKDFLVLFVPKAGDKAKVNHFGYLRHIRR